MTTVDEPRAAHLRQALSALPSGSAGHVLADCGLNSRSEQLVREFGDAGAVQAMTKLINERQEARVVVSKAVESARQAVAADLKSLET